MKCRPLLVALVAVILPVISARAYPSDAPLPRSTHAGPEKVKQAVAGLEVRPVKTIN